MATRRPRRGSGWPRRRPTCGSWPRPRRCAGQRAGRSLPPDARATGPRRCWRACRCGRGGATRPVRSWTASRRSRRSTSVGVRRGARRCACCWRPRTCSPPARRLRAMARDAATPSQSVGAADHGRRTLAFPLRGRRSDGCERESRRSPAGPSRAGALARGPRGPGVGRRPAPGPAAGVSRSRTLQDSPIGPGRAGVGAPAAGGVAAGGGAGAIDAVESARVSRVAALVDTCRDAAGDDALTDVVAQGLRALAARRLDVVTPDRTTLATAGEGAAPAAARLAVEAGAAIGPVAVAGRSGSGRADPLERRHGGRPGRALGPGAGRRRGVAGRGGRHPGVSRARPPVPAAGRRAMRHRWCRDCWDAAPPWPRCVSRGAGRAGALRRADRRRERCREGARGARPPSR